MFLSIINPNPDVRFNGKLRNFNEKVQETYLAMGRLVDSRDQLHRDACNAFKEYCTNQEGMLKILESLEGHNQVHAQTCDCEAYRQAEQDHKIDTEVSFAIWKRLASKEHQAEVQIIDLYEDISSELGNLRAIRDDAMITLGEICGEDSYQMLNDIIQSGEILIRQHAQEVQRSNQLAGVR